MKAILQKIFCCNAYQECLERESDLTKIIEDILRENTVNIDELNKLNDHHKKNIKTLQSKIIIANKLLARPEFEQQITNNIVRTCPNREQCVLNKIDILTEIQQLKKEIDDENECQDIKTPCAFCGK